MQEFISRPLILLGNDDGIDAPGVHRLIDFLVDSIDAEIVAVCPASPQSGKSSAITCDSPLYIDDCGSYRGVKLWSVSGTPVDCVKLAIHEILADRKIDLFVSGINHGSNSAASVIYSGTMGCAQEACLRGINAVGFSLLDHSLDADFSGCRDTVTSVVANIFSTLLPHTICVNINIPAGCVPQGLKVVRAAQGYWREEYKKYISPQGKPFYWLTGHFHNLEPDSEDTDEYWLSRGWATAVPIMVDRTDLGDRVLLDMVIGEFQ